MKTCHTCVIFKRIDCFIISPTLVVVSGWCIITLGVGSLFHHFVHLAYLLTFLTLSAGSRWLAGKDLACPQWTTDGHPAWSRCWDHWHDCQPGEHAACHRQHGQECAGVESAHQGHSGCFAWSHWIHHHYTGNTMLDTGLCHPGYITIIQVIQCWTQDCVTLDTLPLYR